MLLAEMAKLLIFDNQKIINLFASTLLIKMYFSQNTWICLS